MGAQYIGLQARLMSQALRKLTALADRTKTTIIFINQVRSQIGMGPVMRFEATTTPGGRALKFYSSIRIEVKRIGQIKRGENVVGSRVRAKVVKNKVAPPFKMAEFDIYYNEGISKEADAINTGLKYGVVSRSGNTLSFEGKKLGVGVENAKKLLEDIINRRQKKIVLAALSTVRGQLPQPNLTDEERKFFETLKKLSEMRFESLLNALKKVEDPILKGVINIALKRAKENVNPLRS